MTEDEYLQGILRREQVDIGAYSPVLGCRTEVLPILQQWSNGYLVEVSPSGSFAKGTANRSGTDIDLFISLHENTPATLKEIYNTLHKRMQEAGCQPRRQNVSIGVKVRGYDVDLVPAKRQASRGEDHSLYRSKADTWTKTNVNEHIRIVSNCGRLDEIRVLKLWRNQKGLDFPSFYLELTTIEALRGCARGQLGRNVWRVFEYLRDRFTNARVQDPANTNNILSDELNGLEKQLIVNAAKAALTAKTWGEIVR